jgi:hypothetical protein
MGTDNIFWKRKIALERKRELRSERENILIICEGEKTEPNYFRSFRVTSADVKVIGKGANTKRLVAYAKKIADEAESVGEKYDQVWCVFDKDSFLNEQFNAAIQMAASYGYEVAYSNEAFELWYVLHFEYLTAGISRGRYIEKLGGYLGRDYKKNDNSMYEVLQSQQARAIKGATKLLEMQEGRNSADANPSTKVHLLVMELNKYQT